MVNKKNKPMTMGKFTNGRVYRDLYPELLKEAISEVGLDELKRLSKYPYCELGPDFLGFLDIYFDLKEKVPKDFIILDMGCYQAVQAYYFKDYTKYIGIDNAVENEFRLCQKNAEYYLESIQDFIQKRLPKMNLDMEKVFAICSYVPSEKAMEMVENTFKYHRVFYPGRDVRENFPE